MIKCRKLRWVGHVARIEEGRSVFKILTSKPTGMSADREVAGSIPGTSTILNVA